MHALILGAGLMGRAIGLDLQKNTSVKTITLIDECSDCLATSEAFFTDKTCIHFHQCDVFNESKTNPFFENADVVISAVPYTYNVSLTKQAIRHGCHFVDLGGNNTIVTHQKKLFHQAEKEEVTVIPDSGLAPGLVSILTKKLVEEYHHLDTVKLRVGGLPRDPEPPWNYQIVFSANGLINEYTEDALVLDHGIIKTIPSLTQCEAIEFPEPFGVLEAFSTSGGCSTLPYTYKDTIDYLDYKTIRYPGHLDTIKPLFDIGLANTEPVFIHDSLVTPRDVLIKLLHDRLPSEGEDVVLLKVIGEITKNRKKRIVTFEMIDYFDKTTNLSAMMRTTGIPVSITADLIASEKISSRGVFTPEEIVPSRLFIDELEKRNIIIKETVETG
ncbi:MAG: saccharopine dehydrogenase C-terminal domain-containing protein [Candidatus Thermoplasmatota archaeon]|nr:saccharopine dehydrogenase C-terminal domain-containing protein [Candidatus Thermoplasmatota archaeon]